MNPRKIRSFFTALAVAALAFARPAGADEPANFTYDPKPPGQLVDSQIVYMAGMSMHSQWRAVTSKSFVETVDGKSVYQWYLSIYAIDDTTYKLVYQSPTNGGPISNASFQTVRIVGAADLMESGKPQVEELVVLSRNIDYCFHSTLTVLTADAGKVHPAVSVRGDCDLKATIAHNDLTVTSDTVQLLDGKLKATLSYKNGKWLQTPHQEFEMYYGAFPPEGPTR